MRSEMGSRETAVVLLILAKSLVRLFAGGLLLILRLMVWLWLFQWFEIFFRIRIKAWIGVREDGSIRVPKCPAERYVGSRGVISRKGGNWNIGCAHVAQNLT